MHPPRRRSGRLAAAFVVIALTAVLAPATRAAITDPSSTLDGTLSERGDRSITFVATFADRHDLARLGLGQDGSWFPQFGAGDVVVGQTHDNVRDALPSWIGAFNHTTGPADPGCSEPDALVRGCLPTYNFRTFSQDGPVRSEGGHRHWATLRLPTGECGRAGAIVDPKTHSAEQEYPDPTGLVFPPGEVRARHNNTINRIQLQDGVPATFHIGVVTDTTGGDYDPSVVEIRGNVGLLDHREELAESQIEPASGPSTEALASNGVPDVHLFRIDHFRPGDYLKLRLRGIDTFASFGGLLFDRELPTAEGRHLSTPNCRHRV